MSVTLNTEQLPNCRLEAADFYHVRHAVMLDRLVNDDYSVRANLQGVSSRTDYLTGAKEASVWLNIVCDIDQIQLAAYLLLTGGIVKFKNLRLTDLPLKNLQKPVSFTQQQKVGMCVKSCACLCVCLGEKCVSVRARL